MPDHELAQPPAPRDMRPFSMTIEAMLLGILDRLMPAALTDGITVVLPSGATTLLGRGEPVAQVRFRTWAAIARCMRRGTIGFAEGVVEGEIETPDLRALLVFFIRNRAGLAQVGRGLFRVRGSDIAFHASRRNSRAGARRNIAHHYDLGNAFYALWLDAGMSYSSGIYPSPAASLEAAQEAKHDAILAAAAIEAGQDVLEIGCGWGGLAEAAGLAGARVEAVTISPSQHDYAVDRVAQAGLAGRVNVSLRDYRDVTGSYDAVLSIEMVEAVGEENWQLYFDLLRDRLRPGGTAVIQVITIREASFDNYRARPDFIQRTIFPGGMLPTRSHLATHARQAGLEFETLQTFGQSYAATLVDWRNRFIRNWPAIAALGFDERFKRLWTYYLTYCEAGFVEGVVDVGLYRLRRRSD